MLPEAAARPCSITGPTLLVGQSGLWLNLFVLNRTKSPFLKPKVIKCRHSILELSLNYHEKIQELSVAKPRKAGSVKFSSNSACNFFKQRSINHLLRETCPIHVCNRRLFVDNRKILEHFQRYFQQKTELSDQSFGDSLLLTSCHGKKWLCIPAVCFVVHSKFLIHGRMLPPLLLDLSVLKNLFLKHFTGKFKLQTKMQVICSIIYQHVLQVTFGTTVVWVDQLCGHYTQKMLQFIIWWTVLSGTCPNNSIHSTEACGMSPLWSLEQSGLIYTLQV